MVQSRAICLFTLLIIGIYGCDERIQDDTSSFEVKTNKSNKVIVVVVDGPRWDHTFGDSLHSYIPHLYDLSKEGTLYSNFYNSGMTYTNPGHAAISTGFYESIDNQGKVNPRAPSFLHKYLRQVSDSTKAWLITSKDKLEVLKLSADTSYKTNPSVDCGLAGNGTGYREDIETFKKFEFVLKEHKPDVVLLNFREPDYSAHLGDFEGYYEGLRKSDSLVNEIYKLINNDSEYKGRTSLIITNDHGRHLDGVKDGLYSHGDGCLGCRKIFLVGIGKGFEKGAVISDSMDLTMIHSKILSILEN